MTKKTTEIMTEIVELLTPIPSDERQRVIRAALMLLGETAVQPTASPNPVDDVGTADFESDLPPKAKGWAKQNGVTQDMIEQVFHPKDGMFEVIVEPPGKSQKHKTINAYILSGLAKFLATGDQSFEDKAARDLCIASGCYGATNHATYLKDRGNEFTGSRESGWTLTSPGLKVAAGMVKELAKLGD